ncbi:hypothetical protein SO802_034166 [Lithocarpus litseifolius]|uniref:Uncharacterized protein n=1 Tax=Lithocarpus litseifolius TaxID=425828 RepID=A0AAW2BHB4_9ROSI
MGRFKYFVESDFAIEAFKTKYNIPQGVNLRYCSPEQILTNRDVGEVVIPVIAFLEGGMTLPMGPITRDYLLNHRLCPHQCAPNLFRVLGNIDALNARMNLGLRWHDVVHMYECYQLTDAGFYLKSRSSIVRMVSCFPKSNKGMKDDYVIVSGEWHDGLHCPTREGDLGGTEETLLLRLNKLLRSEIYISANGQLRAIHEIFGFRPLSSAFQDVVNTIRAGDSRINRIDVSQPRFLASDDLPPVVLPPQPNLQQVATPREEIMSSRLSLEDEIDQFKFEEEEEKGPGRFVVLSDSEGDLDKASLVHPPELVITRVGNSS